MPNERESGERRAREKWILSWNPSVPRPIRSVPQGGMSDPARCAVSACEAKSRGCLTPKCDEESDTFLHPKMTK